MATLKEYILALGYLQGAIQISKVLDIYQEQTGEEASIKEINDFLINDEDALFLMPEDDWIIHETVDIFGYGPELKQLKRWYPIWIPNQKELLPFSSDDYIEWTPEALAFVDHIEKYYPKIEHEKVVDIVDEVILSLQLIHDKDSIFNRLEIHGIIPQDEEQMLEFFDLFKALELATRSWFTNGYQLKTFQEVQKTYGPVPEVEDNFKKPKSVKTIGRNDPCPCGSGKKYKKCCMDKNKRLTSTKRDE